MADIDAPDLRPFIMLYNDVLKDIGDPTAIALYCALLSYANREKLCHPSLKKLAKDIGLSGESTKTVRRAIDILESKGYVVAFRRWRNQDNDVSTTQDDEFSIPTSNGYHVYTTLGGVANNPGGYGLKTPRGRGQQPLGVGANNPSNYNHMNYNQVELDKPPCPLTKGAGNDEEFSDDEPSDNSLVLASSQPDPPAKRKSYDYPATFEMFWETYPRKVGKGAALRAWKKAKAKRGAVAIQCALEAWLASGAVPSEAQYVPHASTWLNQARYDDPLPVSDEERREAFFAQDERDYYAAKNGLSGTETVEADVVGVIL